MNSAITLRPWPSCWSSSERRSRRQGRRKRARSPKATGQGGTNSLTCLAAISNAGTDSRYGNPNQPEEISAMTNSNPHHPLVLTVLQHVSTDRLQRAVNALVDGSLTVTLTRQTEVEIRALVKNGDKEYGVTLTTTGVFCSCPDTMYRGVTCKHAAVLALSVLRAPQSQEQAAA